MPTFETRRPLAVSLIDGSRSEVLNSDFIVSHPGFIAVFSFENGKPTHREISIDPNAITQIEFRVDETLALPMSEFTATQLFASNRIAFNNLRTEELAVFEGSEAARHSES